MTEPQGQKISISQGKLQVPDHPILCFIEGDGTGPDIWKPTKAVLDAAVEVAYQGKRSVVWHEVLAGEKAHRLTGEWLPHQTLDDFRTYLVGIKGPLTTPVGGGFRSLNVTLRQELDLYACVRPVRWFKGVRSPVSEPEKVDMVIFRENTEDVYAGIEWAAGSDEAVALKGFLEDRFGVRLQGEPGIGIKPISAFGTKRLVQKALAYAFEHGRRSVTLVHKGNIQKYTEGAFKDWGYEVAREAFGDQVVFESDLGGEAVPEGKVLVKDRIADNMFQQVLLHPEAYDVIAAPNLNGDYLSDALAAQVGGIGMAPGANMSDEFAIFEATHGTAPKYAGLNKVNPSSLMLSGVMMLEHLGWHEAALLMEGGLASAISAGKTTYDLVAKGQEPLSTSAFGDEIIRRMRQGER